MPSITFKNLSYHNAEQFKEGFFEADPTIGYVFLGRHIPWPNEDSPVVPTDCGICERGAWDNMFAAKRVTGNDVEHVISRKTWSSDTNYRAFDDTIPLDILLLETDNLKPMYVITNERNVYKCLSNNNGTISTVQPSGDYGSANGTIATADGYIWKYMYNVKPSNKFSTDEFVPSPTNINKLDYNLSPTGIVPGQLSRIVITNEGNNYTTVTKTACTFVSGASTITLENTSNLAANMTVSGTGIASGTFIREIDLPSVTITLSAQAFANGGGSNIANTLTFTTRVNIEGDGVSASAVPVIEGGKIKNIILTSFGVDYDFANVTIFGNGTDATARAVIPPKFGHGFEPAKELSANNIMISVKIGELDSTENGVISTETSFRQYGLIRNPYKYNQTIPVDNETASRVISQTTNITVVSGSSYELNEFVYQGNIDDATFYGFVHSQEANLVRLTGVRGNPTVGLRLIGATSATSRTLVAVGNPEFEPYTGDMLYINNLQKIERTDGQAENIKFVVKF
jgi:hypothetical protein